MSDEKPQGVTFTYNGVTLGPCHPEVRHEEDGVTVTLHPAEEGKANVEVKMSPTFQQLAGAIPFLLKEYPSIVGPPKPCVPSWLRDPIVVGCLRAWAKQPWAAGHGMALADRLEDMLLVNRAAWVRQLLLVVWPESRTMPRCRRRRTIRWWADLLRSEFGDFHANTLCVTRVADTPDESPQGEESGG